MSLAYHQLLAATIRHLEDLEAHGVRHVAVSLETLRALSLPAPHVPQPPPSVDAPRRANPSPLLTDVRSPLPKPVTPAAVSAKPTPDAISFPSASEVVLPLAQHGELPVVAPPSALRSLSAEEKAAAFASLRERAFACVKCPHLASSRENVVFGVGNTDAELMFVGEAPGADEDVQGEPFVGLAGQLLTKIIAAMGLQRGDVYIANILKCRPDMPARSSGNRKPTPEEMQTCIPYLHEQIDLIRPRVLVALGGTAMEGLLNKTGIMKLRGHWHTYRSIPLMPTYHPAYLLRNQALAEKRRIWEDMLQVMEKLEMPVSEKQRNFFLRG